MTQRIRENICNHVSDKNLVSNNSATTTTANKQHNFKMGKKSEYIFLQRRMQMTNKPMERCLSLIIKEMKSEP